MVSKTPHVYDSISTLHFVGFFMSTIQVSLLLNIRQRSPMRTGRENIKKRWHVLINNGMYSNTMSFFTKEKIIFS